MLPPDTKIPDMEPQSPARFTLGKQSSLAPDRPDESVGYLSELTIDPRVKLMYLANEGDIDGIKELLDSGTNVNFRDIDDRTALHVAACQGFTDVVWLLLSRGAEVEPKDRWGSTVILFLTSIWLIFFHLLGSCLPFLVVLVA